MQQKKALTLEAMDSQMAMVLPRRNMLALINVFITNLLNNNTVTVTVQNNRVAVQVCAAVTAVASLVNTPLSCAIGQ
jgi:hypothetical protein